MAFYTQQELLEIGFLSVGHDVKISTKTSIYGANLISIGDFSRIDDFSILSAGKHGIKIGRYVHIAAFCSLIGQEEIILEDYSGLSSRVAIYSSSDDYSGNFMTNPTVPSEFTNVVHGRVCLGKHVIIGVGSTILPGVTIGEGAAAAAYSLINKSVETNFIVGGIPARKIKERAHNIYELEQKLNEKYRNQS